MTGASEWQGTVGRNWAAEWRRTDTSFSELTPHLLAAIAKESAESIADIGCGAGEIALAIAAARPPVRITGVDISPDLVLAATHRAQQAGLGDTRVAFACVDATDWRPAVRPDLLVSRHGVMFFPDPPMAFAHLAAISKPGARMVFTCFRKPHENDWATQIAGLLPAPQQTAPSAFPPGPFAFALPDHVRRCMAGWRDHSFTPIDFDYIAGTGENAVAEALALFQRIGPAASALRDLPEPERAEVQTRLRELVEAHHRDGRVAFRAAAWLVSATSDNTDG
ncbi:MAG: class I SAM-dependent methyltransferase [Novosphingobium meiothermophilum]